MPEIVAAATVDWSALRPGSELTIVKVAPDGHEVTRYPGRVLASPAVGDWIVAGATWTHGEVTVGGLRFLPGDTLHEYFSPSAWFNAFLVLAPTGEARGWYANITRPATIHLDPAAPTLFWHDLYIDIVALPGGPVLVLDEDELAEAGLETTDLALYQHILATRDHVLKQVASRVFPFDLR